MFVVICRLHYITCI